MTPEKTRIFIAGDSTAANYPEHEAPMAGWGQMLGRYMDPGSVEICNEAACGRSSRSFILEGRLQKISDQIRANDYLLIQFGHNDQKPGEDKHTEPFTTYQEHLRHYVDAARQRQAQPVLITPVHRRRFDEEGNWYDTHGEYPDAVRQLALKLQVPLIDLSARTEQLYKELGVEDSEKLFVWFAPNEHPNYMKGVQDNTHYNEHGANEIAKIVAEELLRLDLPISRFIQPAR